MSDHFKDSAVVLFFKGDLQLPESPIALMPVETPCRVGSEIGWLGFPNIEANQMCFFSGRISAWQTQRQSYLIDGVAINGVSGGPVFFGTNANDLKIIGSVSAYHPNLATGAPLPGLARAQDVSQFHDSAARVRNIDEAEAKKREFENAQQQKAQPASSQSGTPGAVLDASGLKRVETIVDILPKRDS
jgi:hypothetical protein